jgi:hypothetical protein
MAEERMLPPDALSDRVAAIERAVDSHSYRAGLGGGWWKRFAALPLAERSSLAENLSRIRRKLPPTKRTTYDFGAGWLPR